MAQNLQIAGLLVDRAVPAGALVERLMTVSDHNEVPRLIGDLRVVRQLGRDGMATVYLAQAIDDTQVAIKLMHPMVAAHPDAVSHYLREANMLARINHPHVIRVHASGRYGERPYLVLELVSGGDAAQLAQAHGGALDEPRAMSIVADACAGLAALHTALLLHRDITPANLLITHDGRAKLGDFGLARTQDDSDRLSASGLTVGNPAYMSPEQAAGERLLDVRSDIYALGATLHALATGQPPFAGTDPAAIRAKVLNEPFPDPGLARAALSPGIRSIIRRATARHAGDRFATPAEMEAALRA